MTLQKIVSSDENIDLKSADKISNSIYTILYHSVLSSMREPFDPMEKAIHSALNEIEPSNYQELQNYQEIKEYPLTDELRAMAKVWKLPDKTDYLVSLKGSPEAVIKLCALNSEEIELILNQVSDLQKKGLRVLGVAYCEVSSNVLPEKMTDLPFHYLVDSDWQIRLEKQFLRQLRCLQSRHPGLFDYRRLYWNGKSDW